MNKHITRAIAFVLMVCLLSALMVPAAFAVETENDSGAYVIDFEIDANENLVWYNGTTEYRFAGTNFAHAQTNNGADAWLNAFNSYYEKGDINFNFPHTRITAEDVESGEVYKENGKDLVDSKDINKVKDAETYKSNFNNPSLFGSFKYSAPSTTYKNTGLALKAAGATYNTSGFGWNALLLRAPDAGVYDVTLGYGKYTSGSDNQVFLLPYTAAMKSQMETDAAAWNAYITGITTQVEAAESYVGTFNSQSSVKEDDGTTTAWDPNQSLSLGKLTVGIDCDEYLMIVRSKAGKACYLQNVTFTPAEEEVITADVFEPNYSIGGTVTSNTTMNKTGFTDAIETMYDNGDIDWSYAGTTSQGTTVLDGTKLYNKDMYALNGTGTADDVIAYEAYKLRSPGTGMYDISFNTYVQYNAAGKSRSQVGTNVYIMEYAGDKEDGTLSIDPATVLTNGTYIGDHVVATKDGVTATYYQDDYVGEYEFAEGKEYIIVLQMDPSILNKTYMTYHNLMAAFVIESQEEILDYDPKAYIGLTPYPTVAEAAAAAQTGETIKLAVDFVGNIDLPAGVSLDLNGHTWTVTSVTTTTATENVIDSVGTGSLVTKDMELYAGNDNHLPLATGTYSYNLAEYTMTADSASDIEASPDNDKATRFWFKLSLTDSDAYNLIAAGDTGLTIGVKLKCGTKEVSVTFDNGEGAEAFAADWAAAAKANSNIWLFADIVGVEDLTSDLSVTPVLGVNGQTTLSSVELVKTVEG